MRKLLVGAAAAAVVAGGAGSALAAPANVPAIQSTIKYTRTATGATSYGNYARATSKVVYDSATGTYTVRDTGSTSITSTFGPANIDAGESDASFTVYKKGTNETLRVLKQSPTNPLIALTYTSYAHWRRTGAPVYGPGTGVNDTYIVFGSRTPSASVPRVGGAHYSTVLDGTYVNKNGAYEVSGTGNLNANFASGTITYDATAIGTKEVAGPAINFGTMTGTGSIAFRSSGFNGTGTTNGSGYKLDVNGHFYGPAANEVGGVFRITGNGGNGTGAIVGNQP